jgi:hypothetical protein
MNKQPDKIFRDKLEGYQKQAPTSAWEKIALTQTKKKHKGLWIKIAAAILLISVAAFVLWPSKPSTDLQLADKAPQNSSPDTSTPPQEQRSTPKTEIPVTKESSSRLAAGRHKNSQINKKKSSAPADIQQQNHNGLPGDHEANENASSAALEVDTAQPVAVNKVEANQPVEEHHSMTLVYTANDVSKYLNKKELDEATSDDKKPSTLKKLLKKANDLTNNQDPFGELRQKKNEILALNFKNEKRGQNK